MFRCRELTLSEGVLFDVLSADGDVFEEALSGMCAALLHRVLGAQSEHSQVFEGQQQFHKSQVQLLCKDLTNLVALVLHGGTNRVSGYEVSFFTFSSMTEALKSDMKVRLALITRPHS